MAIGWVHLAIAALVTLGLTSLVAAVIHRPLFGVLQLICGCDTGARFWTAFTGVLLVMGPLFLVFACAGTAASMVDFVRRSVFLVSFGVIAAFLCMGAAVMRSGPSRALSDARAASIRQTTSIQPAPAKEAV